MELKSVIRRLGGLALIAVVLPLAGCFEDEEEITVQLDPCSADDLATVDNEVQAVFALLTDDGTDLHDQVEVACDDVMGDDYLVEECTSSGPGNEECETVIEPPPAATPEEEALQDECVVLIESAMAIECEFGA